MEAKRDWLDQFPENHRGAIAGYFYNTVRDAAGISDLRLLCAHLYRDLCRMVREEGNHFSRGVNKLSVMRAVQQDPEGVRQLMAWVIQQEARSPEERARDKEVAAEEGKRRHMEGLPPTQKQLDTLLRLGVDEFPDNRWRASELIEEHKTW